jgi:hypothetical protein
MNAKAPAPVVALLAALAALAGGGIAHAQSQPPVPLARLPHINISSPVFYWSNAPDVVRTASATCPKGRAIGGGLSIQQGNASIRIQDSYPDGASWVVRFASRPSAAPEQTLQVRAFATCLLPVARDFSVQFANHPRLLHQSQRISIAPGGVSTTARQACPQGALVIGGGLGLDAGQEAAQVRLELSFPDPLGWNIRAVNDAGASEPAAEVRVHGVCIGGSDGVDIRNYQTIYFAEADVILKPGTKSLRQSVACGDGKAYAIAGGLRLLRGKSPALELRESYPDTPSSWTLTLANRGDKNAGDARVRLTAVCIKP